DVVHYVGFFPVLPTFGKQPLKHSSAGGLNAGIVLPQPAGGIESARLNDNMGFLSMPGQPDIDVPGVGLAANMENGPGGSPPLSCVCRACIGMTDLRNCALPTQMRPDKFAP